MSNKPTYEELELKKTEEALKYRLRLEALVSTISTSFINADSKKTDDSINLSLQLIGKFSDVDRCYVFIFYEDGLYMENTHEWCKHDIEPQIENLKGLPSDLFPWWMKKLRRREHIYVPTVDSLPPEASAEKRILQSQSIRSVIVVPMVSGSNLVGFLGFDSVKKEKTWLEEDILLLKTIGNIFVNVLKRVQAEEEKEDLICKLQESLKEIKTLSGLLPICASCKKIRDDKGYWRQIESYIREHSEAEFSHSICPKCKKELYPYIDE